VSSGLSLEAVVVFIGVASIHAQAFSGPRLQAISVRQKAAKIFIQL
jgi:hypothetical protein